MSQETKKSFLLNTMILTLAGAFARVLGAVYRIFLTRIIGDEGIGLYQMAYNLALLFMTVGMTGLPLSISKLVAEKTAAQDERSTRKVLFLSLFLSGALGLLLMAMLGLGASFWVETNLKEPRALMPLRAISPAVLFVFLMAPFRGYFQGRQEMIPRAVSDAMEQLVRVVMILTLALLLLGRGVEAAATGAALGVTLGSLAAFIYLLMLYLRKQQRPVEVIGNAGVRVESNWEMLKRIVLLAVPVTLGSLIWPLMQFVDALLISSRLQTAGFAVEEATALFGRYSGQAGPLVNMPSILTVAVAASLIPSITEAMSQNDGETMRSRANLALKVSTLIALPAALGLSLLSQPVATILYGNANSAGILAVYSWVILFLLLYQTSASILQGIDRIQIPVFSMLIGIGIKTVLTYVLCGLPQVNIFGAAIATSLGFVVAVAYNLYRVYEYTQMKIDMRGLVISPVISTTLMGVVVYVAYHGMASRISMLLATAMSVLLGVLVYGVVLLVSGGLRKDELQAIPKLGPLLLKLVGRWIQ